MKNSKSIIGLIVLAVVLVAAGVTLGMNWHSWFGGDTPAAQTADKLQVDPNAGDYVAPEPEEQSEGIAIPGWGSISLPAGKTAVSVDFANPDANADKYYLSFELRLKDTGEVLCTTGLVPPGKTIQNITLARALDAGESPAVVHVQPYTMDEEQTATNNADMETTLIVK